jgi:excisionase family DNA binding protein
MLTVEDLAERWGVNHKTIRDAIQMKQIVALRLGRALRISRAHVETLESRGGVLGTVRRSKRRKEESNADPQGQ